MKINKTRIIILFLLIFFLGLFLVPVPDIAKIPTNENSSNGFILNKGLKTSSDSEPLKLELNQTWGTVNSDEFHSMTIDSEENIYAVGMSDWQIITVKFNSTFDVEWSDIYINAIGVDIAHDVALDSEKNVYVTGAYYPTGASHSYLILLKYNNSGNLEWTRNWGTLGNVFTRGRALVIDSEDNIFVAGETDAMGAGDDDICLVKYNSTGDEQWYKLWGGANNDICYDMVIDDDKNLFLSGHTESYGAGESDAVLIKYNSSGIHQWNRTWGDMYSQTIHDMVLDSSENIYLCGGSRDSSGTWYGNLLKYDSSGDYVWSRSWDLGTGHEMGYGVSVDDFDQLYLASYLNQPYTGFNIVIMSYSTTGDRLWEYFWGTSAFDIALSTVFHDPNTIYLAGITSGMGAGGEDGLVLSFSTHPVLNVVSPVSGAFYKDFIPTFQITVVTHYLDEIWYSIDSGNNYTAAGTSGALDPSLWNSLDDGNYELIFYANDTYGEVCHANVSITKDTTSPNSELSFVPYVGINKVNISTIFTITSDDGEGSGVIAIYSRIGSAWNVAFNTDSREFLLPIISVPGFYNIEFYARDDIGNIEEINSVIVELIDFIVDTPPPAIPGYSILLIIASLGLIVVFLKKKISSS